MNSAHFTADYVAPSLDAASKLIGKRIVHFERLTFLAPEPPAALDYGSLLIECEDGFRLLIVDELQQANLLVRPVDDTTFSNLEDSCRYWTPVFDAGAPATERYGWPFQQPIESVERVCLMQEPGDYLHGELCGLRLRTGDGEQITLGLSLTGESGGIIEVFRGDDLQEDDAWRQDLEFERIRTPEPAGSETP